ncbi:hypothetical protein [Caldimonas sp. KR1-144]|uniref:hypothetical protein n=1 Tax=Caldimonas sp. KR1-144 TaxID=3400911 RepID=UPI003C1212A8
MKRHAATKPAGAARRAKPAAVPPPEEAQPQAEAPEIVERPDGFYWQSPDGEQEFGPFESFEHARANRDGEEDALAPGALLREAERDIGIADWIDAESGEPAEGGSPPHLSEE